MGGNAGSGVARELLVVLGVAAVGLLLGAAAAFTPWYPVVDAPARPRVVELHSPVQPPIPSALNVADAVPGARR